MKSWGGGGWGNLGLALVTVYCKSALFIESKDFSILFHNLGEQYHKTG